MSHCLSPPVCLTGIIMTIRDQGQLDIISLVFQSSGGEVGQGILAGCP